MVDMLKHAFGLMLATAPGIWPSSCHAEETDRTWTFNPGVLRYPSYIADPDRARFAVVFSSVDSDLEDTSSSRIDTAIGTRMTIVETQQGDDGPIYGIDAEAGLLHQFDNGQKNDSIGKGRMGIWFTAAWTDIVQLRTGWRHSLIPPWRRIP